MNPTKLVLQFFDFSVIFYAIYKNQGTDFTISVALLQQGPWKELWPCNVAPGRGWPARVGKIRRAHRRTWQGKGWGGAYGPLGSGLGRWIGVERLRRGSSAATGSVAAAAAVPDEAAARLVWSAGRRAMVGTGVWENVAGCSRLAGNWSSPRLALRAPAAARVAVGGGSARRGMGQRRPYRGRGTS
jgi:hypothetical protein